MNITQFFPTEKEIPPASSPSMELCHQILSARGATYRGFARLEAKKGFLSESVSLSTPRGQEMMRILLFRVLEESAESLMSTDPAHIKEEVIDAMNYLLAIPLLDGDIFPVDLVAEVLCDAAETAFVSHKTSQPLDMIDLGSFTKLICGDLADTFRNRAWMNQAQDIYFSGDRQFLAIFKRLLIRMFWVFDSFDEFLRFFIAKDRVLQFRLRSSY